MAIVSLQNVRLALGGPLLFDGITLSIERGEKVALVGRNGSGKTTLLRLIEGSLRPDSGTVAIQRGACKALLSQEVPGEVQGTVLDVVASGLQQRHDPPTSDHTQTPWEMRAQVDKTISQLGLDAGMVFNSLSAGLKRQTLLGKALAGQPDILLLDEPTNHMDIEAIGRLEELLSRFTGALVVVTHDRMFLQRVATRIVEIDRGSLFDQSCDYETFRARKQAALETEETNNALFDKKLEKEERWVRQGIKARRTRNEGRVRELETMREMRAQRRERPGLAKMSVPEAERSGQLVAEAKAISFSYGDVPVISKFSTTILKGDRVGILGRNGCGKTTLLRILLGDLRPASGSVRIGTGLQICYFDQLREQLDQTKTVRQNVSEDGDVLTINGKNRHVISYLKYFLFSSDRANESVSVLSGGERNRLLLARLFARPSNLLVLDEPTNDLDGETLELFEDLLLKYSGTILLVSHDRAFINNVVTSTIAFEGNGIVKEYIGGYDDWLRQRPEDARPNRAAPVKKEEAPPPAPKLRPRFGYRQEAELNALPDAIKLLETEQEELLQAMCDPGFYKKDKSEMAAVKERLESVRQALANAYERWAELEALKAGV